jgi:hypothetical protein
MWQRSNQRRFCLKTLHLYRSPPIATCHSSNQILGCGHNSYEGTCGFFPMAHDPLCSIISIQHLPLISPPLMKMSLVITLRMKRGSCASADHSAMSLRRPFHHLEQNKFHKNSPPSKQNLSILLLRNYFNTPIHHPYHQQSAIHLPNLSGARPT